MKGSIRQRGPQTWQITLDLGRDVHHRRRRRFITVQGPNKKDAQRELTRQLHAIHTGTFIEAHRLTIEQYLAKWLEHAKERVSPKTLERYAGLVRHQIAPRLGQRAIAKLTPLELSTFYAALLEHGRVREQGGLSAHSVRHVHVILRSALRQAVKWQILARDPSDAVQAPRPQRLEMRALDEAEAARLLQAAARTRLHLPVLLALSTGLRRGELLALRWGDADLERSCLSVQQTLESVGSQLLFKQPKTPKSRRTVALPALAVDALRSHRAAQAAERLLLGADYRDRDLVFATPTGEPWRPDSISTLFRAIVKKAQLGHVRFHDLRHTHATQLLRLGVNAKIVSERLGHSTIGVTLDTYSHVLPGMQEDAAHKVDVAMRAAIGVFSSEPA